MSSTERNGGDSNEDKLSESSVDTLVNEFDEDIRLAEEEYADEDSTSSSSEEYDFSRIKRRNNLYYYRQIRENDSPHSIRTNKSSKHAKLRHYYNSSEQYQDASRLLRSKTNDDDDVVYSYNPDDENRVILKTIMVGNDFQAQVPEGLCHYDDALPYENEDKLVWDPSIIDPVIVEDYLKQVSSLAKPFLPMGTHLRDNEQALYLLQQCGHNVEEALRRFKMNVGVYGEEMSPWSEEECRNFEAGVRIFGKNFYLTQQKKVRTRSVGELVQFYYLWKKTERHDVFSTKTRLGKKKYILHPGLTDFMDRFLEEHDNSTQDRSLSPLDQKKNDDESQISEKN